MNVHSLAEVHITCSFPSYTTQILEQCFQDCAPPFYILFSVIGVIMVCKANLHLATLNH